MSGKNCSGIRDAKLGLLGLCLLMVGWVELSHATLVVRKPLSYWVQKSELAVWGKVSEIYIDPASGYRFARLSAKEVVYSQASKKPLPQEFFVRLENRKIPNSDLLERVVGAPDLKKDDELVLLLSLNSKKRVKSMPQGEWNFVGFDQGVFRVVADALGARKVFPYSQDLSDESRHLLPRKTKDSQNKFESKTLLTDEGILLPQFIYILQEARSAGLDRNKSREEK